jgi:ubiquinone/menaquinone biosynthesis C-methylase UbiE
MERRIADMHNVLIERLRPHPGERWLDIGCGAGGVAFLAAEAGAETTGVDLAPMLVEAARRRAADRGLELRLDVGDVENLPYDEHYDVISSSVGLMFAPDPGACARELARVSRPGSRIGITAWRPDGGDSPYAPSSGEESWEEYSTSYGPSKTLAESLDAERREELHRAWVDFHERYREGDAIRQSRTYLLTLGTRR